MTDLDYSNAIGGKWNFDSNQSNVTIAMVTFNLFQMCKPHDNAKIMTLTHKQETNVQSDIGRSAPLPFPPLNANPTSCCLY